MMKVTDKPKIDSLKLRLPLSKVNITSDDLGRIVDLQEIDRHTGEVKTIETGKEKNTHYIETPTGIKNSYKIQFQRNTNNEYEKHLIIGLPSKLLKEVYFNGITSATSERLFEETQAQQQAIFSYEDFITGQVTDIDICRDIYLPSDEFESFERYSKQNVIPSDKIKLGYMNYPPNSRVKRLGFQYNIREQGNKPFYKMYDKYDEMQEVEESKIFRDNYLQDVELKDLKRVEVTIKGKTQMNRWYGIKELNTLQNLIGLPQKTLSNVLNIGYQKNIHQKKQFRTKETGLTGMDIFAIAYIMNSEKKPLSILTQEITELMKANGLHRNTITKSKKRLKQLFNDYHQNTNSTDKDIEVKNLQKAFTKLGLNEVL